MDESTQNAPVGRGAEAAPKPRVLIADDQSILREGLRALLAGEPSLELVGSANDRHDAVRSVGSLKPDVVLIELSMPNMDGLSAIGEIKRRSGAKTLVLTVHKTAEYVRAALKAGADGYVLREASRAELLMAIDTVLRGKRFISPAVSHHLVAKYLQQRGEDADAHPAVNKLTARETQVLKRIAEGNRNRDIAEQLAISVKTVEKHRSNLMHKLKLHNTAALTSFAIQNRLAGKTNRTAKR